MAPNTGVVLDSAEPTVVLAVMLTAIFAPRPAVNERTFRLLR
ncbi:hypothetical protein [Actinomadura sp. GTD37]